MKGLLERRTTSEPETRTHCNLRDFFNHFAGVRKPALKHVVQSGEDRANTAAAQYLQCETMSDILRKDISLDLPTWESRIFMSSLGSDHEGSDG